MPDRADLAVVGGGIVGLATAWRLLEARPGLRLVVLEKEERLAAHQTGRNSGVIHSPNTYAPGSLKARLCAEGMRDALAFADEHGIPYEICGEMIVATEEAELPRLAAVAERAAANGVALRELGPEQMREVEPEVRGLRALHVPGTGIIDWGRFALSLADAVRARGGEIRTGAEVTAIRRGPTGLVLERPPAPWGPRHDHVRGAARRPPGGNDRGRPRDPHRPVPRRLRRAAARGAPVLSSAGLPGCRPALPVPRRPPDAPGRRRGVGRPERGPGVRPRGVSATRRGPARPGRNPG